MTLATRAKALRERLLGGDSSVTPADVDEAEREDRHAALLGEAADRAAVRAAEVERLARLGELRAEVEEHAARAGGDLAGLLEAAVSAVQAFRVGCDHRARLIDGWRARMDALEVPRDWSAPVPPPDRHGQVARDGATLVVGARRVAAVSADDWLASALGARLKGRAVPLLKFGDGPAADLTPLEAVDAPRAGYAEGTRFFRGPGGAVLAFDREPTADEQRAGELVEITEDEAAGR